MTKQELGTLVEELELVFDIVRLVDVSVTTPFTVSHTGELTVQEHMCYDVWCKDKRCENCISAKAFMRKTRMTKFEFIGKEIYYVISMYIEVECEPYMLEMVMHIKDSAFAGVYRPEEFAATISNYNQQLYTDPLTDAYNRRYYEDHLVGLTNLNAVVMLDADDFKSINDHYGHQAGDMALQAIVKAIFSCVRNTDEVIRYGGDEFLLIFHHIPQERFADKLEEIRKRVDETKLEAYPDLHLTVSIGAVYQNGDTGKLVHIADEMLYQAKKQKNQVQVK